MSKLIVAIKAFFLLSLSFFVVGWALAEDVTFNSSGSAYTHFTEVLVEDILTHPFSSSLENRLVEDGYKPDANCIAIGVVRNPNVDLQNRVLVITDRGNCGSTITKVNVMLVIPEILYAAPFKYLFLANQDGSLPKATQGKAVGGFYFWSRSKDNKRRIPRIDFLCSGEYQYRHDFPVDNFKDRCVPKLDVNGTIESIIPK